VVSKYARRHIVSMQLLDRHAITNFLFADCSFECSHDCCSCAWCGAWCCWGVLGVIWVCLLNSAPWDWSGEHLWALMDMIGGGQATNSAATFLSHTCTDAELNQKHRLNYLPQILGVSKICLAVCLDRGHEACMFWLKFCLCLTSEI